MTARPVLYTRNEVRVSYHTRALHTYYSNVAITTVRVLVLVFTTEVLRSKIKCQHLTTYLALLCALLVEQEKSLGGLCRRFVQLFLVGNEVVSVAEAAEKLSDPMDVCDVIIVVSLQCR